MAIDVFIVVVVDFVVVVVGVYAIPVTLEIHSAALVMAHNRFNFFIIRSNLNHGTFFNIKKP